MNTSDDTQEYELEFYGPLEGDHTVYDFVADLRGEGLQAEFSGPPTDTTRGALESVATGLIVAGSYDLIKVAVARWRSKGREIRLESITSATGGADTVPGDSDSI